MPKIFFIIALVIVGAFALFFNPEIISPEKSLEKLEDIRVAMPDVPKLAKVAETVKKEVAKAVQPPPLRVEKLVLRETLLTRSGVIDWTNAQRKQNSSQSFRENTQLNLAAAAKLADMFQRQYFAHYDATGRGASDFAKEAGYKFLGVGENLALGNFEDDKDLIQAWMDSPGHRANILDDSFQEIGVAVKKGMFEGENVWLAVQIFALPYSACPQPDKNLKIGIESSEKLTEQLAARANVMRADLENRDPKTKKEVDEYNALVEEYNALVKQINALVAEIKILISRYNDQVRALNECVAG